VSRHIPSLALPAPGLRWDYPAGDARIQHLYEQTRDLIGRDCDIDWTTQNQDPPAASSYGRQAFDRSALGRYGADLWVRFWREQQAWMVGQFLHGEHSALVVSARLAEVLPDVPGKSFASLQAADEARHLAMFTRFSNERLRDPYPVSESFARLLSQILDAREWDVLALGMQVMIESLALGAFRLASTTFDEPVLRRITHLTAKDEARHVLFGVLLLDRLYASLTEAERRYREDFVLEAADLLSRRYLMAEIWERLGVPARDGAKFARSNPMMRAYRQAIFGRVVHTLARIGLITPRVRAGMGRLGLLRASRLPRLTR
jgi:hypothetical protein